jgi:hypothetical protein
VICLSGSTALLGTLKFVGDVDYCEYATPNAYSTMEVVAGANAHAVRTQSPLCERVKVMSPKWSQVCTTWDSRKTEELARLIDNEGAYQLKLDFIASTSTVGTAEATNMVLLLAVGREDEIVRASFAGQEVPISGSLLPRPLCEPLQLGRYINFLIEQVQHYGSENPVKALKRALSLARILMLPEWCDTLIEQLRDPRAALTSALEARSRLLQTMSTASEAVSSREQTREALRDSLNGTVLELERQLAHAESQSMTQGDPDAWAAQMAWFLGSFIQDARRAIAAG